MPPVTKYSKQDIINAAIQLIDEKGLEHFSVRNVAGVLKSSIQPIYSNFSDVSALLDAVLLQIKENLLAYTKMEHADQVFRNMGVGFALFARDFPNQFTAFYHKNEQHQKFIQQFLKDLREDLELDDRFAKVSSADKDKLLETMWIFTYGYANLIVKGIITETSNQNIADMVIGVGTIVIKDTLNKISKNA